MKLFDDLISILPTQMYDTHEPVLILYNICSCFFILTHVIPKFILTHSAFGINPSPPT